MPVVDVHTHFHSLDLLEMASELGAMEQLPAWALYGARSLSNARGKNISFQETAEMRVSDMDHAGIDLAILSAAPTLPNLLDPRAAERLAHRINDDYLILSELSDGRLRAFAALPLPHVDLALRTIESHSSNPAFVGFDIGPSVAGIPLDDERFDPVWERLNQLGSTVFVHPGASPVSVAGSHEYSLSSIIVGPAELAVAIIRLAMKNFHLRFPRVNFIFAVAGGMLPTYAERFDGWFRHAKPEEFLQTGGITTALKHFWYDTSINGHQYLLDAACATCGPERLVLGSDHPKEPSRHSVDFIRDSPGLTDAQKQGVLTRASSFLHL